MVLETAWGTLGAILAPGTLQDRFWIDICTILGAILGAKMAPFWGHVGSKIDFWGRLESLDRQSKTDLDFKCVRDRFYGRIWGGLGTQDGPKIASKSHHTKKWKLSWRLGASSLFQVSRGMESLKNRLQDGFKIREQHEHEKWLK